MLCGSGGPGTGPPAGPHTLATTMHRAGTTAADAAALLGHTVAVHLATYATPLRWVHGQQPVGSEPLFQRPCETEVEWSPIVTLLTRPETCSH